MASDISRKIAIFVAFILLVAGLMTMMPDAWLLGNPSCHSCHESSMPASHMLYRTNLAGYNSLCSFAPVSTLILICAGLAVLLTTFKVKFEKWGREYRKKASMICIVLAFLTVLPVRTGYENLIGGNTLCPAVPVSTIALLGLGMIAYAGFIVCPFLILWRCRCPVLENDMDIDSSPHKSVHRFLRMIVTGKLSQEDVKRLYRCTLCNGCWLSAFNRSTRQMVVNRGIIAGHLSSIRESVGKYGNPYGIAEAAMNGAGPVNSDNADTILFAGCTSKYRTPEILSSVKKLLDGKGIMYRILDDETCCGYTLFNLGDVSSAYKVVDSNIIAFKRAGIKRIITLCPGCYSAFNMYYKGRNSFNAEVILAIDLLKDMKAPGKGMVVHDPCHAKDKGELVRKILAGSRDEGTGTCCGAGGGVMSFDHMLAGARAGRILEENPGRIITYCPFCYLNLSRIDADRVSDVYVLLASQEALAIDQ